MSMLQCVEVCCSVWQCVVGSVLQRVTTKSKSVCPSPVNMSVLQCVAEGCSVLQSVAACCSAL